MDDNSTQGDDPTAILPGVKKAYRPDWLDDANKVFINRLNDVCSSYQDVFSDVSARSTIIDLYCF